MTFKSTREAAQRLGMRPDLLQRAIWLGRVQAPAKSPSGDYLWTEADVERAALALHRPEALEGGGAGPMIGVPINQPAGHIRRPDPLPGNATP